MPARTKNPTAAPTPMPTVAAVVRPPPELLLAMTGAALVGPDVPDAPDAPDAPDVPEAVVDV